MLKIQKCTRLRRLIRCKKFRQREKQQDCREKNSIISKSFITVMFRGSTVSYMFDYIKKRIITNVDRLSSKKNHPLIKLAMKEVHRRYFSETQRNLSIT